MFLLLLLTSGLVIACGGDDQAAPPAANTVQVSDGPTTTTAPAPDTVISNFAYAVRGPVKPGQQATIANRDDPSHSVTADDSNSFDIRVSGGGGEMTFTAPTAPGSYAFHCKYHANMHGT